jgi:hypothetical protein
MASPRAPGFQCVPGNGMTEQLDADRAHSHAGILKMLDDIRPRPFGLPSATILGSNVRKTSPASLCGQATKPSRITAPTSSKAMGPVNSWHNYLVEVHEPC